LKKNPPWGTILKFSQRRLQLLVVVRRGAGTCDDPYISGRVLDSAFTQAQARVRLSCSNRLITTGSGATPDLPRSPREHFFSYIIRPNSFFVIPEESLSSGVRRFFWYVVPPHS